MVNKRIDRNMIEFKIANENVSIKNKLYHKMFDGPMELCVVIITFLAQTHKIIASLGNLVAIKFHVQGTQIGYQSHITFFFNALVSNDILVKNGCLVYC